MNAIGDGDDDLDVDFDEAEMRDELTYKMRTRGALVAYKTALAICEDPNATAAAKASAVNSLLRAGGFFANPESGGREKDPSEMTPAEVKAALRKAEASLKNREDEISKPKVSLFD
jgi:hypothetical protein